MQHIQQEHSINPDSRRGLPLIYMPDCRCEQANTFRRNRNFLPLAYGNNCRTEGKYVRYRIRARRFRKRGSERKCWPAVSRGFRSGGNSIAQWRWWRSGMFVRHGDMKRERLWVVVLLVGDEGGCRSGFRCGRFRLCASGYYGKGWDIVRVDGCVLVCARLGCLGMDWDASIVRDLRRHVPVLTAGTG